MEITFKLLLIAVDIVLLLGAFADEDKESRKMYFYGFIAMMVLTFGTFLFLN